jgi:iron complex transport system permease protein
MSEALSVAPPRRALPVAVWVILGLLVLAASMAYGQLSQVLPPQRWAELLAPQTAPQLLLIQYGVLPRMCIALLTGTALGLAGTLFQTVLRSSLAEPSTLGVSAGAYLALSIALLYAPGLLDDGREWVAMAGASVATLLVVLLAARRGLSPLALIIGGMLVTLYCGTSNSILVLFNQEALSELFVWQAGDLTQIGWANVQFLAPRLALALLLTIALARMLDTLSLGDAGARGLGVSLGMTRVVGMLLATWLSACVVSSVGVIAFLGLAAPHLVRLGGVRRLRGQLLASPVMGAALLWLADELMRRFANGLPTGIASSLLGAVLLLWLLPRLRDTPPRPGDSRNHSRARALNPWRVLPVAGIGLVLTVLMLLFVSQGHQGWHISDLAEIRELWGLRAPRVIASLAAGAMLAIGGVIIQRMTGNPMASPEVMGISSGAALGVILLFLMTAGRALPEGAMLLMALGGAFITLLILLGLGWRSAFAPDRMLLTGVVLATLTGSLSAMVLISGDPRLNLLLSWMSGSTYRVDFPDAWTACAVVLVLLLCTPLTARWLDILPLGGVTAQNVGVPLARARLFLLLLTALATATATLIVGPLSFVGLIVPHILRMSGVRQALPQLLGAALLGAVVMSLADWLGRTLIYPWQIPAGLMATFIGGPYFMLLILKRKA